MSVLNAAWKLARIVTRHSNKVACSLLAHAFHWMRLLLMRRHAEAAE